MNAEPNVTGHRQLSSIPKMSTFNLSLNHHLELPDDVFRLLRDSIYKRTGMWFADSAKYLLQKRLSPRARELNFDSFQKYFYFLQYDPRADTEFDQIYDLVTTNETYFFREPAQLAAFTEEIVPDILTRKGSVRDFRQRHQSGRAGEGAAGSIPRECVPGHGAVIARALLYPRGRQ